MRRSTTALLCAVFSICLLNGQVYSPLVLKRGQADTTNLAALATGIFAQSHAQTDREKAEAVWRFFLTDGRFVKPGMMYHVAGWAYEEPTGEVLDPIRLLNSYGFGLCYHIAPLLESVFKAAGFTDARVWFLTGHTVAEVFYDGGYHYFDSDMMGYNPIGTTGPLKQRLVASVHQIELDGSIITGKLVGHRQNDVADADTPWYPADVHAHAIGDLAELFTTSQDNWVYPFQRYQLGHTMDFVLRPGERMVRYFHPEPKELSYLPYRFDGTSWREFPQEIAQYHIRTADGPQSQKDGRRWATGLLQYSAPLPAETITVYSMPCPYVIIDARFQVDALLRSPENRVILETSTDAGQTWLPVATLTGPHRGGWSATPAVLTKSEHGTRNAVSGTYGYLVRLTQRGAQIRSVTLTTRFQLNPRTLPQLEAGTNELEYSSSGVNRWELPNPVPVQRDSVAAVSSGGQSYLANSGHGPAQITFALEAPDGGEVDGFDAGGRFLDLRDGLAPDKFTAEVRKVAPWPAADEPQLASVSWSTALDGEYRPLWTYDPKIVWKDQDPIRQTLRWPEVDRQVRHLVRGTHQVYVRYQLQGMAVDSLRFAVIRSGLHSGSSLQITHAWLENGKPRQQVQLIRSGSPIDSYSIEIPAKATVSNQAFVLENIAGRH